MGFIEDFSKTWADPQMRHAMVVHWPIVMSFACTVLALALALCGGKNLTLRIVTLVACVIFTITAYMALNSGTRADNSLGKLEPEAERLLEEHEELGEKVPLFAAVCAGLMLATFVKVKPVRLAGSILGLLACGTSAVWVANTAHHGGLMVYE